MPRRRSASPSSRASHLPARAPAASPPVHHAPPPQAPAVHQEQPSMFKQMAATAGGVAVGSAVGHTIGHAMTGMFSGSGSQPEQAAPQQNQNATNYASHGQEPTGPCAWEIKQFLQCAQGQSDLTLCEGFNEALRQCKTNNNLQI